MNLDVFYFVSGNSKNRVCALSRDEHVFTCCICLLVVIYLLTKLYSEIFCGIVIKFVLAHCRFVFNFHYIVALKRL